MNKLWLNKKGFNQYRFKIVFFVWDIRKIEWLSAFFNVNFHPRINSTSWLKLSILQTLSNYLFNRSKIIFGLFRSNTICTIYVWMFFSLRIRAFASYATYSILLWESRELLWCKPYGEHIYVITVVVFNGVMPGIHPINRFVMRPFIDEGYNLGGV